jgi:hypothetical protein
MASKNSVPVPAPPLALRRDEPATDYDELRLDQCSELDLVMVKTRNSVYEVIVQSAATGDVLIRGGRHFPQFTQARIVGSTCGRSAVRLHCISLGMTLELETEDTGWLTSPICSVSKAPIIAPV